MIYSAINDKIARVIYLKRQIFSRTQGECKFSFK